MPIAVIGGSKSPLWMRHDVHALAPVLSHVEEYELTGQTHLVKPKVLAAVLVRFYTTAPPPETITVNHTEQEG